MKRRQLNESNRQSPPAVQIATHVDSPISRTSLLHAIRTPRQLRAEVLAGLVTAFALIPECTSFAIAAGVSPRVGLFSAAVMAMVIAFTGGRSAMASGAAGSVALVLAPVVRDHGAQYLVATVLLGGLMQIVLGVYGVARLMRYIPQSVMAGFVNGLAVLIFMAQLPHILDVPVLVYPLVVGGVLIVAVLPRWTSVVPAPLVAILVLTVLTIGLGWKVPTVGDEGPIPQGWPKLLIPEIPRDPATVAAVATAATAMALVGLMESLMTAKLVDELTDTRSNKRREAIGQGVANLFTGLFGGIGGCAMIGQTILNVKIAGARTRLSTFLSGAFVLLLVVAFSRILGRVPMAALVAVMVVVAVTTFDWRSMSPHTLRQLPVSETAVTVLTMAITTVTANLAYGVISGVLAAIVVYARGNERLTRIEAIRDGQNGLVYRIYGDLFFASSHDLADHFDYDNDPSSVTIDMSASRVCDASSVAAINAVCRRYAHKGKHVAFINLDQQSHDLWNTIGA